MAFRSTSLYRVAGFAALTGLCLAPTAAHAQFIHENTLSGVTLAQTFRDVLRRLGQPTEIQIGEPMDPADAAAQANTSGGGSRGAFGGGARGGGLGRPGGGLPGRGGQGGAYGRPGGGSGGGLPGFGGSAGGGGLPGFSGGPRGAGGGASRGGAGPLGGRSGGAGASAEENEAGEVTWWYNDEKKQVHTSFLFSKLGKVIQIQEYGYKGGAKTKRGVALGASLQDVIHAYGWSSNGSPDGESLTLRYGGTDQVQFQLYKNKVVGITIGVVKPPVETPPAVTEVQ